MSVRSWGTIGMDEKSTVGDRVKLGFDATKMASENGIGVILGGNVASDLWEQFEAKPSALPFEIVDDPISNVAQETFAGDEVKVLVQHRRVDKGESLDSRMTRVQRFLERLLQIEIVKQVVLHISEGFGEETVVEIAAGEFKSTVLDMYKREKNWTPTVKFVLRK